MGERLVPVPVSYEFPGSELSGDVLEFIQAMAAYQKRYRRRYPAWSEILYVLRTLGYAKRVPGAVYAEALTPHPPLPPRGEGEKSNDQHHSPRSSLSPPLPDGGEGAGGEGAFQTRHPENHP